MFTTIITITLAQSASVQFAEILDLDGDGIIYPMEAADAIQRLYEEEGDGLPVSEVEDLIQENETFLLEEARYFIEDFDKNSDGVIQYVEISEEYLSLAKYADLNNNQEITVQELLQVNPDSVEVFAQVEIDEIFSDLDKNKDGLIELELFVQDDPEFAEMVLPFDTNKDLRISLDEMVEGFALLDASVSFEIMGRTALMHGIIDVSTPFRVMELVHCHPEVKTIVMVDVPGSVDDDSMMRASRIVRKHGLNTHVPSNGEVASGGTDFFQAGVKRTCERGSKFGIHSWSEFGAEGSDYPRDSEEHKMYLDYYDEMGIPEAFYWYSLEAASASDIHWMTNEELHQFNMLTVLTKE